MRAPGRELSAVRKLIDRTLGAGVVLAVAFLGAGPVPVTMRLVGPVSSPTVTNLDLKDAVASIVKGAAAGALGKVLGGSGQGGAEQQAREAAQKQEQAAQQKAQEAAKKAADQASNKLKGLFGR